MDHTTAAATSKTKVRVAGHILERREARDRTRIGPIGNRTSISRCRALGEQTHSPEIRGLQDLAVRPTIHPLYGRSLHAHLPGKYGMHICPRQLEADEHAEGVKDVTPDSLKYAQVGVSACFCIDGGAQWERSGAVSEMTGAIELEAKDSRVKEV